MKHSTAVVVPFLFPCGFIFSLVLFSVSLDMFQVSPKGEKNILACPRASGRTGAGRWPPWHHGITGGWICTWGRTSPSGSVAIPVSSLAYNLNFVLLELAVKSQDVLNPDLSCGLYGERAVHSRDFPLSSLVALNLFFFCRVLLTSLTLCIGGAPDGVCGPLLIDLHSLSPSVISQNLIAWSLHLEWMVTPVFRSNPKYWHQAYSFLSHIIYLIWCKPDWFHLRTKLTVYSPSLLLSP